MNNSWHPECFRCDLCQEVLADIGFVKNAGRYEQGTSPHKAGGWVGRVVPQGHLCSQVMHGQCGVAGPVGDALALSCIWHSCQGRLLSAT